MKTKKANALPQSPADIANGGVYIQRRRCGKSSCRCASGDRHVGYYFVRRINGKFTKTYIRQSEVEQVAAVVNKAAADRQQKKQSTKAVRQLIKSLNTRCRDTDSIIKKIKGGQSSD